MAIINTGGATGFNGSQQNQFAPAKPMSNPTNSSMRNADGSLKPDAPRSSFGGATGNVGNLNKDPGAYYQGLAWRNYNYAMPINLQDASTQYYMNQADAARGAAYSGVGGGGGGTSKLGGSYSTQTQGLAEAMEAYGKYQKDFAAQMTKGFNTFRDYLNGIVQNYGISKANISAANSGLNKIINSPGNIELDPVYKTAINSQENALTRQLIAQGHNPAETGFGANVLAESSGRLRLDALNNMIDNYAKVLGYGNTLANTSLGSIGGLMQGQTNMLSSRADAMGNMLANLINTNQGNTSDQYGFTLANLQNMIA